MIDINEDLAIHYAWANRSEPFKTRRVGCDHTIEFQAAFGPLKEVVGVQKLVLLRDRIFVPAQHFFAFVSQCQRQAKLGANAITVRPDMSDHAKGAAFVNGPDDAFNNLRVGFHQSAPKQTTTGFLPASRKGVASSRGAAKSHSTAVEPDFSSSSMISITRFPRPTESSI